MKDTGKKKIGIILTGLTVFTFFFQAHAQNTLNKIGLTAATPSALAYSLRQLSSSYVGPAARVRRSSDGELRDVYFDVTGTISVNSQVSAAGGGAATATLLSAWIGANSGTVNIWYDQSGNAYNASQATAAKQPTLISAGAVALQNGKPTLLFSGGQTLQSSANATQITTSGNISTSNFVYQNATANSSVFSNGDPGTNRYNIHAPWGDGNTYFDLGDIGNGGRLYGGLTWTGYAIGTYERNGAQGTVWKNGVNSLSSGALATSVTSVANMWIGSYNGTSDYINGALAEMISFVTALSTADRTTVECSQSNYYSISIASGGFEFYVQNTPAVDACTAVEEQVVWQISDLSNVVASGNNLTKNQPGGWNGGAASWNTVAANGYFQFTASETTTSRMAGLSNSFTSSSYTTIQYAFYLVAGGSLQVYESGAGRGAVGTYNTGDLLKISVEGTQVKYYQNGTVVYISTVAPTLPLLVDVSINSTGGTITNALVGNYYSGTFTATAVNAGSPAYQWLLNAAPVGTNSATYTNNNLSVNDVVSCNLTYTTACGVISIASSNSTTNRALSITPFLNLFIAGNAAVAGCNNSTEQVAWQVSSLSGVQATGNNLIKLGSNGVWNGGAASWNTVSTNGYFQFTASETSTYRMAGLSNAYTSSSYTTIQYAFYLQQGGVLTIYESGTSRGNFGTYAAGDIFKISVEANGVKYYQNGNLLYISTIAPTLPLLADVSIYSINGTVTNALIVNPNVGTFSATVSNAGSSPAYQWQVNGSNVGTNSATYTNTSLANNDVVTCQVTPNLNGCSVSNIYTSNSITNQVNSSPASITFAIDGVVAASACTNAAEQVVWQAATLSNVQASGNSLLKFQSNGGWNGGAASINTVSNNGYFQFTATETTTSRMAGLSTTYTSSSYTTIQYAFYLVNSGALQIYESGVNKGAFGTYASGDVFKISVENNLVKYYQNGNLLYISGVAPTLPMLVDVSISNTPGTITNALVANTNTGSFIASTTNAGASPTFQWLLNGGNVGTNSPTYSNPAVPSGALVTCQMIPNLAGCTSATTMTSNTITEQNIASNSSIDFYVQGTPATSACNTDLEQVVWQKATLTNLQATGNSLSKIQNGGWNGGAASWNTVSNDGYFQFSATEITTSRMAGLSTTYTSSSYTTIQYAFYLVAGGTLQIYESGAGIGGFGTYAPGDIFRISVESNVVKYYQNGNLLYISAVTPTLPMLVDVSINTVGGTITNALVSNYNTGVFTATVTNAGASPTYQWFRGGVGVGSNSPTYTNAALNSGDVITCQVIPNLAGCSATNILTSNTVTNLVVSAPVSIDFYIQGTVAATACNTASEQVVWQTSTLSNLKATGNNLLKIQSNGNWNGGAASWNTVANNGYFQFTASEITTSRMAGLSSSYSSSSYTTIQYAIYLVNGGGLQIYESGVGRGAFGTYSPNDVFKISVEAGVVKYYQNGNLLYSSGVAPTLPLLADVSINSTTGTITNAIVSNFSTGVFTAASTNSGASPTYQWFLNGTGVGTTNTYTNAALNNTDLVTCMLTPNLGGCSATTPIASNSITNLTVSAPANIGFYIAGSVATAGCNDAVENVSWQASSLTNQQATGNSLTKAPIGGWNGGAASYNTVANNGYFQFTASETTTSRMAGLSTSYTGAGYVPIQYAFYLVAGGALQIYESGASRGGFGTFATGDLLKISVENNVVKYYQNGNLLYISGAVPTLPLLVDVSINTAGGTVNNAIVANYNVGVFTATAINAGTTPTYQWYLNGTGVGTNSATYTNTALGNGAAVTCLLTPNVTGCSSTQLSSNIITNSNITTGNNIGFYIENSAATSGCNDGIEQVVWQTTTLANVTTTANSLLKTQNGGWNAGGASWNMVGNNGYFQFTASETTTSRMAGLSTAYTSASYTTIQYAFYLVAGGGLQIYESGTGRGAFGTYNTNDILKISVEANVVKYYQNGTLLYISTVSPTLPMLVDVSINSVGGTINSALVVNLNVGTFTATAINAGATPSYAWFLNAAPVGTNSNTYTNTSLAAGNVITCILTPSLGGCSISTGVTSNTLTNQPITTGNNINLVVQGTAVAAACNTDLEQVVWQTSTLSNVQATGNSLLKIQSNGNWDGAAASFNTVANNGYFQFTASETSTSRMIGLSTTFTSSSFTTIQYAFYLVAGGGLQIYESGTGRGAFGTYATSDILKITVEASVVKYYQNGTLLYISGIAPTLPLLVDTSIQTVGGTISNALVSNYNTGLFTATAINAGAAPTYQWQLNSVNVGTNSTTYTNTSLNNNDVVTCVLTPNLGGCSVATTLASNTVTNLAVAAPTGISFYLLGALSSAACTEAIEQVVWQTSTLSNVQATGNNLNKIQSNANWNGGAASWNTVSSNGYFQFTASETTTFRMIGLSSSFTSSSYTTIQYAFYLQNGGTLGIYESGIARGNVGTYTTSDILKISVEGNIVKYYQNGAVVYTSLVAPTLPMLVDASIYSTGGTITNALVVNNASAGVYNATAINAGATPTYTFFVNGSQTQTGTGSTYTNNSLIGGNIVTCTLTPNLGGCSTTTYNSNSITINGPGATATWTGASSGNWNVTTNWSGGVIPDRFTSVTVPSGTANAITLTTSADVYDLTINPSANFTIGTNNKLFVFRNFTNNGTFTQNTSTVNFVGCGNAGTVSSSATETFYNIAINSSLGLTMTGGTQQVSNNFTFTSGIVTQNTTLLFLAGSSATGASAASYVNGPIQKAGTTAFVFPTGTATKYAPIGIGVPSASTTYTAKYFSSPLTGNFAVAASPLPALKYVSGAEYWTLNQTVGAGNATVTLYWQDSQFSQIADCSTADLRIARYNGTLWENNNNSVSTTGSCSLSSPLAGSISTTTSVTKFGPFTFGSLTGTNPLPIELVNFRAAAQPSDIAITWQTLSEINADYFQLQRGDGGELFSTIATLHAAGTTNYASNYSYLDRSPMPGKNYYRLRSVDFDGVYTYSETIMANFEGPAFVVDAYPNPTSWKDAKIQVRSQDQTTPVVVKLVSSMGDPLYDDSWSLAQGNEKYIFAHDPNLASGVYILTIIQGNNARTVKMVIVR